MGRAPYSGAMQDSPTPPPGWYPQGTVQRYWDGTAWTTHTAEISPRPPAPPPSPYAGSPGLMPGPYGLVPATSVAPKSPALALLASFFIPGLGSMLNGDVAKGIGILIGYVVSWVLIVVFVGIFGVFAFWVWGMVDAYVGAQRWNARYGILS